MNLRDIMSLPWLSSQAGKSFSFATSSSSDNFGVSLARHKSVTLCVCRCITGARTHTKVAQPLKALLTLCTHQHTKVFAAQLHLLQTYFSCAVPRLQEARPRARETRPELAAATSRQGQQQLKPSKFHASSCI